MCQVFLPSGKMVGQSILVRILRFKRPTAPYFLKAVIQGRTLFVKSRPWQALEHTSAKDAHIAVHTLQQCFLLAEMLHQQSIVGGSQTIEDNIRNGYLSLAFPRAKKRAEMLCHPVIFRGCQPKNYKIRNLCLTPALFEAQKRAEILSHLCIVLDLQTKKDRSKVAPSRLLSRAPQRGRKQCVTFAFQRLPIQKRTRLKLAASLLPSREPILGRNCEVTASFGAVSKQQRTKKKTGRLTPPPPCRLPPRGQKCYFTSKLPGLFENQKKSNVVASSLTFRLPKRGRRY